MTIQGVPRPALVGLDGREVSRARAPAFKTEREYIDRILQRIGEIDVTFLFNDVLVVKYEREMVSESLVAAPETQKSDYFEGVVGAVLLVGPTAFQDDNATKFPWDAWIKAKLTDQVGKPPIKPGDWVLYRATDGWDKHIQLTGEYSVAHCRVLQDAHIRGVVKYPGRWW